MKLNLTPFPSNLFSITGTELFAEASDLGSTPFQRLYDDACDEGFAIRFNDTGIYITFYLGEVIATDEIQGWKFYPINSDTNRYPQYKDYVVTIFND